MAIIKLVGSQNGLRAALLQPRALSGHAVTYAKQRSLPLSGSGFPSTQDGAGSPPRKPPVPPKATADFGDSPGDGAASSKGWFQWQGWQDRVAADPQFVYKVLVEQIIGVGAAVFGDMSTRPDFGIHELDFVFSTLVVGSLMNFALMYLLAPVGAKTGAASSNLINKMFDERTLLAWGAPGGHIFEPGFSLKGRAINLLYKTFTFGIIGFCAGLVGTVMSNTLILVRQTADKNFVPQNESPPVLLNSLAWTLHMGISSNLRYQTLNGLDGVLVKVLPAAVFKTLVVILRTANNVVGGMSFVTCARIVGSQPTIEKGGAPA